MTAREIVEECRRRGVLLRPGEDGATLLVKPPGGELPPDLRALLVAHKPDVLRLLTLPAHPCTGCGRFAFVEPRLCYWCAHTPAVAA